MEEFWYERGWMEEECLEQEGVGEGEEKEEEGGREERKGGDGPGN